MPTPDNYPFPNQLRRFRHQRNMRLIDVARKTGHVNLCQIVAWEKGKKLPSLKNAIKLANALKVPVEVLFIELTHEVRRRMSEQQRE
jgi:DNA-binding XRE family transcriptional regulator